MGPGAKKGSRKGTIKTRVVPSVTGWEGQSEDGSSKRSCKQYISEGKDHRSRNLERYSVRIPFGSTKFRVPVNETGE